jgi:hypothetical protein
MSDKWIDPAKLPPKAETMNTPGDFGVFTETMKRIIHMKPPRAQVKKPRRSSSSPAPAHS